MSGHGKNNWRRVQLGSLAEFRNGVNFSKENFGKGIKVIGVSDFQNNVRATFDQLDEINPQGAVRPEHLLRNGDILFVRSNGNRDLIGRSMYVDGVPGQITHSAFSIRLRFTSPECCPRFYSYLFRSQLIRQALSLYGGGTNISNLNQDILGRLQVPVPPLATQRHIAETLAAYDDLIDNNTRRIKILEQMAQMLYREWFVNFRFPGHEKVRMAHSELGAIPSGWTVGQLSDIAQIQWGDTSVTKASYVTEGGFRAFSASGPDGFMDYFDLDRTGIVLSAIGANCGLTWYACGKWSCIKNTICFWADEAKTTNEFLYFATKGKDFWPKRGSAQPFISQGDARAIKLVIPPHQLTCDYSEFTAPMISLTETLGAQNENLRKTRDLLIPKLISGELGVEHPETVTAKRIS